MEKNEPIEMNLTPPPEIHNEKIGEGKSADNRQLQNEIPVQVSLENRIEELKTSVKEAKKAFESAGIRLRNQILLWSLVNLILIVGAICFACYLLNPTHQTILKDTWTWQIIYYTVVRITVIGGIFSLATYCLKLLSSHIQMYQHNQHKRAIIDALPGFVESGIDPEKRDIIFNKLVEMIVKFDDTGIIGKKNELKTANDFTKKILEILLKKDH